ncbi:MAG: glutaminyl-peptide cyclotransferase, partial [Elusimicrobia bacterium]|nr:glutaminyl-peptide cyclotransferase [Elusimicrobiota bacterium]
MIASPGSPDSSNYSPPTDVAGIQALFKDRAPLAYSVVKSYPHDPSAFTEGLVWHDGHFYESTGLKGESDVRKVDANSGAVLQSAVDVRGPRRPSRESGGQESRSAF